MASSIGPARQALWQLLLDATDLEEAQKSIGWPDHPSSFVIALLGVSDPNEIVVLLGPEAANEEQFGIELAIKYHDPNAPEEIAADVDATAFGFYDTIRDAIRANRTLRLPGENDGTVRTARITGPRSAGTGHPAPSGEQNQQATGLMCVIEMTVACVARAT